MSTYTESLGLELITPGSQAGLWGNTTNNTFALIDQAITGVTPVSFASASGSTYTLTDYNGAADESRSAVINITGSASGSNNIVVPNKQKTYLVRNNTGQDVVFKTASPSATYTVGAGYSILIFCDGNNNVFTGIASPGVGTLSVNAGGTGATTFTAGFVKSTGGTNALTSSTAVALGSEVSGVLPVANGGTGQSALTSGALLVGNGTGSMAVLTGGTVGYIPTWNGSTWVSAAPASGGVTSVFGRTGAVTAQSTDYSSYYPTLTGSGASGTWPISISGGISAASTIAMATNSSTRMTINSSGNVGIGTTNPQKRLHVVGPDGPVSSFPTVGVHDVVVLENNSNSNLQFVTPLSGDIKATYPGASGPFAQVTLNYNSGSPQINISTNLTQRMQLSDDGKVYIGSSPTASVVITPGSGGSAINFYASSTGNSYNSIYYQASGSSLASQAYVMAFNNGGSAAASYVFNGNGTATAANWSSTSDARIKENVVTLQSGLDKIAQLRPVEFSYKRDNLSTPDHYGLIAQELEQVLPNIVADSSMSDGDVQNIKSVSYTELVPILIKAVQELKAEVDALKAAK